MHTPEKIRKAIKYVVFSRKPVTLENVNRYLQIGDKIDQAQLDAHIAASASGVVAAPTPEPESEASHANDEADTAKPDEPAENVIQLDPPPLSIAGAQHRLVQSQVAFRTASQRVRELRSALGAAVARWQKSIGTITTPEMNARAFIASETALRAARAAGIAPERGQRRRHRSAIDAMAAATNYGGNRAGGGNSFRRVIKGDDGQWHRPKAIHDIGH